MTDTTPWEEYCEASLDLSNQDCELGDDMEHCVRIDADELELVFKEAKKLLAQKTLLPFNDNKF